MEILKIKTEKRRLGSFGEDAAAKLLRKKGYKILERGFVALGHEIDIIAENREYLIFVEVKTRTSGSIDPREPRPASAVGPEKQRSIISSAKFYPGMRGKEKKKRFDVIEVYASTDKKGKYRVDEIKHLESAFNYNTAYKTV